MARALLLFERRADSTGMPTIVILATPERLQGRALPGNPDRDARLARYLSDALPPRINDDTEERGTYEDWITWALNACANGMTSWATEVVPTATVDELFQREVLDAIPAAAPVEEPEPDRADQTAEVGLPTAYRVEASERDDDLLRHYLPAERPSRFDSLPFAEQAWRSRLFLMTWAFTGSAAYAWALSGVNDPTEVAESIELVAGIPDSRIEEELICTEGQRRGVIFGTLGEPDAPPYGTNRATRGAPSSPTDTRGLRGARPL
jgi:hypothetical protein